MSLWKEQVGIFLNTTGEKIKVTQPKNTEQQSLNSVVVSTTENRLNCCDLVSGSGYQEAGIGYQEAGSGYQEAGSGYQEAGSGYQEAGIRNQS